MQHQDEHFGQNPAVQPGQSGVAEDLLDQPSFRVRRDLDEEQVRLGLTTNPRFG